jgi:hypothetical protein
MVNDYDELHFEKSGPATGVPLIAAQRAAARGVVRC